MKINKIFIKIIDKKIEKLGFKKVEESDYCVSYERYNEKYSYMHCVDLLSKSHIPHIIQTYDKADGHVAGVSAKEAKLFAKRVEYKWGKCKS